jgi:hypothetical protein
MLSITHSFVSTKADGTDTTVVRPSNWNATHVVGGSVAFSELTGNIATTQMAGGTGASSTTFWRGDGTWAVPAGGAVSSVFGRTGAVVAAANDYSFAQLTGNIATTQMAGGTGASSTTYWRGDGTWAAPAGGAVSSVFGRTGAVVAAANDYSFSQLSGNIATSQMGGGTGASATTFWRGDGTWATPAGGGGTPGGANTQIQYNSAGAFAGSSNLTFDGTNITTAGNIYLTANYTGVFTGGYGVTGFYFNAGEPAVNFRVNSARVFALDGGLGAAVLNSGWALSFGNPESDGGDTKLFRDGAAGILAQRNGTSPQSFRVYNTYTDASNYERGVIGWNTTANTLTIGTQALGTGVARPVSISTSGWTMKLPTTSGTSGQFLQTDGTGITSWATPAGGGGGTPGGTTGQLQWNSAGAFGGMPGSVVATDGSSLTLASQTGFVGSRLVLAGNALFGGADSGVSFLLGYNQTGNKQFWLGDVDGIGNTTYTFLRVITYSPGASGITSLDMVDGANTVASPVYFSYGVSFGSGTNVLPDAMLKWDAPGIIAQRNGTTWQSLRVYNTFTDASNYERAVIGWNTTANVLTIGAQAAGTGSLRLTAIVAWAKAGAPVATDIPVGTFALIRDTSGGTTKLYYNNAGTLQSVTLT